MSGELVKIGATKPHIFKQLANAITAAVKQSFRDDVKNTLIIVSPERVHTAFEERRRIKICIEWVRILGYDLGWSTDRIADQLPYALRAKLDGIEWNPEKQRAMWAPASEKNVIRAQ